MNLYTGGQVAGAAVSVLPATVAYSFLPAVQSHGLAISLIALFALWGVSYFGVSKVRGLLSK